MFNSSVIKKKGKLINPKGTTEAFQFDKKDTDIANEAMAPREPKKEEIKVKAKGEDLASLEVKLKSAKKKKS